MIDNCLDDWRIAMTWQRVLQIGAEVSSNVDTGVRDDPLRRACPSLRHSSHPWLDHVQLDHAYVEQS